MFITTPTNLKKVNNAAMAAAKTHSLKSRSIHGTINKLSKLLSFSRETEQIVIGKNESMGKINKADKIIFNKLSENFHNQSAVIVSLRQQIKNDQDENNKELETARDQLEHLQRIDREAQTALYSIMEQLGITKPTRVSDAINSRLTNAIMQHAKENNNDGEYYAEVEKELEAARELYAMPESLSGTEIIEELQRRIKKVRKQRDGYKNQWSAALDASETAEKAFKAVEQDINCTGAELHSILQQLGVVENIYNGATIAKLTKLISHHVNEISKERDQMTRHFDEAANDITSTRQAIQAVIEQLGIVPFSPEITNTGLVNLILKGIGQISDQVDEGYRQRGQETEIQESELEAAIKAINNGEKTIFDFSLEITEELEKISLDAFSLFQSAIPKLSPASELETFIRDTALMMELHDWKTEKLPALKRRISNAITARMQTASERVEKISDLQKTIRALGFRIDQQGDSDPTPYIKSLLEQIKDLQQKLFMSDGPADFQKIAGEHAKMTTMLKNYLIKNSGGFENINQHTPLELVETLLVIQEKFKARITGNEKELDFLATAVNRNGRAAQELDQAAQKYKRERDAERRTIDAMKTEIDLKREEFKKLLNNPN